jgi:hypothetical protein
MDTQIIKNSYCNTDITPFILCMWGNIATCKHAMTSTYQKVVVFFHVTYCNLYNLLNIKKAHCAFFHL